MRAISPGGILADLKIAWGNTLTTSAGSISTTALRPRIGPREIAASFWRNRALIAQMTKREVVGRYKGSVLGLVWSFIFPLLMLGVYWFAFGYLLKVSPTGPVDTTTPVPYALWIFTGLIMVQLFSETLNRAPLLILQNANYVKKVIFPLEVLPWVIVGAALVHALMSVLVLLSFEIIVLHAVPWTALLLPVVLIPLMLFTLGFAWFLSSLGVYLRDVAHTIGVLTTVLMWTSCVFIPLSRMPPAVLNWIQFNPLTWPIEAARQLLLYGLLPSPAGLALYTALSLLIAWLGFAWFQRTKRGFADVL